MRSYTTHDGRLSAVSVAVPNGSIRIEVREPASDQEPITASVRLAPQVRGDDTAEQAIADAVIAEHDGTLTVTVPHRTTAFARTGFATSVVAGRIIQSAGDLTLVDGRVVGGVVAQVPSGGVEAVLSVPAEARLLLEGRDCSVTVTGPAGQVTAAIVNGSVRVEHADTVVAEASSGSIHLGEVANVEATIVTGTVLVDRVTGSAVLRTANGTIRAHTATSDFSARSANGTVTVSTEGVTLPDSAVSTARGFARVLTAAATEPVSR